MADKQGSTVTLTAGVYRASSYGKWQAKVASGPVAAASPATLQLVSGVIALPDGRVINPFGVGGYVSVGTGANAEEIVISTVTNCFNGAPLGPATGSASIAGNTSNIHGQGDIVTSSSGGLFEACLDATNAGGGTVVLDESCSATSTQITNAQSLYPLVDILDYRAGASKGIAERATVSGATPATYRLIDSELTVSRAGTVAISASGSLAALRGNVTVTAGTTVSAGFLYGAQGKVTVAGSWTSANFLAGVIGQLDLSAVTAFTAGGPVQAGWFDMGASITGSITTAANANIVNLTNTTACAINAVMLVTAKASLFADLNEVAAAGVWITGTTASTAAGTLKIKANGNVRYIQLYSGVA